MQNGHSSPCADGNHHLSLGLRLPTRKHFPPRPAPLPPFPSEGQAGLFSHCPPRGLIIPPFSHVPCLLTPHMLSESFQNCPLAPTLSGPPFSPRE